MRTTVTITIASTLIVAPAVLANGNGSSEMLWDNMPDGYAPGTSMSSQLDVAVPFDSQVADDFSLAEESLISSVRFIGGFWNGEEATDPFDFNVIFHENSTDAAGPAPVELGTSFTASPTVSSNGDGTYTYEVDLGGSFTASAGTTYWVAIQAALEFPPQWGIEASNTMQGSEAYAGFPLLGTDYWTTASDTFGSANDSAFQLFGGVVPAPSALALLALAGCGRRRRR